MPSIQVKGVPDEIHAVLRRRAAADGRSLQEYVLGLLRHEAETPALDEVLERIGQRSGGSVTLTAAATMVRAERDTR